ncbi:hypothetical protein K3X44_11055 [Aliiroseovarius crassostreae]|uniref:hypothetical protein n=1 Tax=Aliiroseovarius crassostreae TaxID=154981 RepID=UPI0022095CC5|nr:hypothetical protein [Aliiroseovarius crassostreae]UWQ01035.1 hypothetical protein K3X44_11055 [Aliiroseovarius crassostreae]
MPKSGSTDKTTHYKKIGQRSLWFNISVVLGLFLFLANYFTAMLASARNTDVFLIGQFRNNPAMTEAQQDAFYTDYVSLLRERYDLTYDLFFVLASVVLLSIAVVAVTALIERKKFSSSFHPLPQEIQSRVLNNAGASLQEFQIGKTLGPTCVRLRKHQIVLSPDHLFECLGDSKRAVEILRHELIHSIARDPAFNFLFNALLYISIAPVFLVAFFSMGTMLVAFEEVSEISTGAFGSVLILAWVGGSALGIFKVRQALAKKFYDAKEAFANFDSCNIMQNASWVYFSVLTIISAGYALHPDPSVWVSAVIVGLLLSTLFVAQVHIGKILAALLATTIALNSVWLTAVAINYGRMMVIRDPSSFELYAPSFYEVFRYTELLPLLISSFILLMSLRK